LTKSSDSKRGRFLRELKEAKKRNFEDNLKFVHFYAAWVKSKTNKEWSKEQKRLINMFYRPATKRSAN
jgi:hypothetical protein